MIKVLFFDFDGTISDAKKIAYDSMVRVLNEYDYGFDKRKLSVLLGSKMEIILKELGLKTNNLESVRKTFYEYFTEAAVSGGIKPCVSMKPLWELKKNYPLIVISNSERSFLGASVKKLKLNGLFENIYGTEKFGRKSDMLKKLFKKMKINPSEAIYIGDRFSDIDCAREAKCIAVAIHNRCSWSSLKVLKEKEPDYIIKDFMGLRKLVEELNLKNTC